jgi:AcrR family transcriptional regulator
MNSSFRRGSMANVIDKQSAIMNTALKLLVENGFHNTPMSLIAKEAGVSAGIIYHYFESKEDLIHQLYRTVEAEFTKALISDQSGSLEGMALLRQLWLNSYAFYVAHPNETLFMEQYKNSPFYKEDLEELSDELRMLLQKLNKAMANGEIADLPLDIMYDLTMGVAMALAKRQIAHQIEMDEATLQKVADAVCRSVQAG